MPVSDKVAAMFAAQEARNAELDRRLPEIAAAAEKERNQKLDAEFAKESPRLSKELNARDPTTVLGLATNLWPGARQAKVTGVMRERLLIGATGFSPIREELAYPFEPPLQSVEEVSKRFDALRGEALRRLGGGAPEEDGGDAQAAAVRVVPRVPRFVACSANSVLDPP